jgi:hypothetical protein
LLLASLHYITPNESRQDIDDCFIIKKWKGIPFLVIHYLPADTADEDMRHNTGEMEDIERRTRRR